MCFKWEEKYYELLCNYIEDENELSLYLISLLGKELIENGISPDEVVEVHVNMFKKIVKNIDNREWIPCIYKSFNLLIELMTAYGNTHKEHIELRDQLKKSLATQVAYKRLKFYVDEIEFITERLASMNEELDHRIVELSSLQKVSKAINSVLEFDQLLDSIIISLGELVEYDCCSIMLIDDNTNLILKKVIKKDSQPFIEEHQKLHILAGEWVVQNREACIVSDIISDNRFKVQNLEARSLLVTPMELEKEVIGVICLDNNIENKFTSDTSRLLSIVSAQAGIAIKNACSFEEIKKVSMTDGLTGLFNHRYFYERLKTELDWAKHYNLPLSLLMIDIDNFKNYNDTFGHTAGDSVLRKLAEVLLQCTREEDVVARYGGEEFAVILISVDIKTAETIAERIREQTIQQSLIGENKANRIFTISLGVSSSPDYAKNVKQLVDSADKALYKSKQTGKNKVSISSI